MNKMNSLSNIKFRPTRGQIVFWAIAIGVAVAGFLFVRGLVTCWRITPLAGSRPSTCGTGSDGGLNQPTINDQGTPIAPVAELPPAINIPDSNLPPAWDGASRITVLIIGLDYRDYLANDGPPRSDTMILLTIDPLTKTAGMLSIPRDMWVNIPGFQYGRINMAYFYGEGSKLPGQNWHAKPWSNSSAFPSNIMLRSISIPSWNLSISSAASISITRKTYDWTRSARVRTKSS